MSNENVSIYEIQAYLEEMLRLDLHNSVEERIYNVLIRGTPLTTEQILYVVQRMYKWDNVKF